MTVPQRLVRGLLELAPPFVVAVLLLPWIIAQGKAWPWEPSTIDLQVYVYAVRDMLAGGDIYATTTPGWNLYFIYPPVAAVLMVPLVVGPYVFWQLAWTALGIWAQQSVLKRCGVPRGWKLGLIGAAVVVAVEPIRTTLGYGQVNTLLMALVVADLLRIPEPVEKSRPELVEGRMGSRPEPVEGPMSSRPEPVEGPMSSRPEPVEGPRKIPPGTLIGLAAAIKLTPALFVVFAFLTGKRRVALTAILSFVAFTLLGAIFQWSQTLAFWTGLAGGQTRTAAPLYTGNQSLLGVFHRLGDDTSTLTTLVGLAFAAGVALLGTLVAAQWWADGERVFAVALVGLTTCLASPLSWTHHYVWVLPLGAAVVLRRTLPTWVRVLGGGWVVWVSLCLPLAALPYGYDAERTYTAMQELVANLGPLLGLALILGLAWRLVTAATRSVRSSPSLGVPSGP